MTTAADPVVRKAGHHELEELADLWVAGWRDGHEGRVPPELLEHRTRETFGPRMQARIPTTWVAELDGTVLGFVVVKADEVEQIYVDQAARGTGVAGLLLRHAESVIAAAGHTRAWLAVVSGNKRARRFYAKQGWTDDGPFTYQGDTAIGPIGVPAHRYVREVTGSAV